ncbi:ABC transporter permease [Eisenbergiella porci]|uniref:ABC transporter permease n=1 Tax=Eisenbergiella porci TaxID=2652274 RepID=UPI002A9096C9|nr:ABC transporter permease [Eisenbergiella porci]MDY5525434.1 ABC transporter permease [Eisenbergiella porci]
MISKPRAAFGLFWVRCFCPSALFFSLGFFFTAIARDMKISNLLCYVSYFVMIFLSGATMPKEMFPEAVKKFSAWLPLTYVVELLQGVFLGAAFEEYRKSLVVLGTILIVCTASGAALYRRKSWV